MCSLGSGITDGENTIKLIQEHRVSLFWMSSPDILYNGILMYEKNKFILFYNYFYDTKWRLHYKNLANSYCTN